MYHPLANDTGGDLNSRVSEAHLICRMVEEFTGDMTEKESEFIEQMVDCDYCSPKQLFWLRDIKDKYL